LRPALGFLAFTAAGAMTSTPTARHPLQSEMSYLMDFDAGRAFWLARAESWDRWKAEFLALRG